MTTGDVRGLVAAHLQWGGAQLGEALQRGPSRPFGLRSSLRGIAAVRLGCCRSGRVTRTSMVGNHAAAQNNFRSLQLAITCQAIQLGAMGFRLRCRALFAYARTQPVRQGLTSMAVVTLSSMREGRCPARRLAIARLCHRLPEERTGPGHDKMEEAVVDSVSAKAHGGGCAQLSEHRAHQLARQERRLFGCSFGQPVWRHGVQCKNLRRTAGGNIPVQLVAGEAFGLNRCRRCASVRRVATSDEFDFT